MKFASLGSGSEGNALLIAAGADAAGQGETLVLLDCGFGIRETERRLALRGRSAAELAAIVVTHEHQDHIAGVFKLARRYHIPVWLSYGTWQAASHDSSGVELQFCRDGEQFAVGALTLQPYTVPHDAREPVQYVASDGRHRLGILTDAGQATAYMLAQLAACDALLLECNYDPRMLAESHYPPSLKRRIASDFGHLSNQAAAGALRALDHARLNKVVACHLSTKNNLPELARAALEEVVDPLRTAVLLACQAQGFDWLGVGPGEA